MKGFIGTVKCECGRHVEIKEYELMFVGKKAPEDGGGYTSDYGISKPTCANCGREYEVQITMCVNGVYELEGGK